MNLVLKADTTESLNFLSYSNKHLAKNDSCFIWYLNEQFTDDPKWHTPKYYRVCEVERMERQAVLDAYARQNITVVGLEMPNCTPDGFYAPVRKIDDT